jgi:hypothetical protein
VNGCIGMRLRVVLSSFIDICLNDFMRDALWIMVVLDEKG